MKKEGFSMSAAGKLDIHKQGEKKEFLFILSILNKNSPKMNPMLKWKTQNY